MSPAMIITSQHQGTIVSLGIVVAAFAVLFIPALIVWAVLRAMRPQGADRETEDEEQAHWLRDWREGQDKILAPPVDYVVQAQRPRDFDRQPVGFPPPLTAGGETP